MTKAIPHHHLLNDLLMVLALPSETFVYFDQPMTVIDAGGEVRDRALGLYNWVLDIHLFTMEPQLWQMFACHGNLKTGRWYSFTDFALFDAYKIKQHAILEMMCEIKAMDGSYRSAA